MCDEVCHHVLIGIVSKKKCLPGSHMYILVHKSPRQVFLYYIFLLILAKYSDQAGCQHQHLSPETHEHYVVEADMESKVNTQSPLHLKQLDNENNALPRTQSPLSSLCTLRGGGTAQFFKLFDFIHLMFNVRVLSMKISLGKPESSLCIWAFKHSPEQWKNEKGVCRQVPAAHPDYLELSPWGQDGRRRKPTPSHCPLIIHAGICTKLI